VRNRENSYTWFGCGGRTPSESTASETGESNAGARQIYKDARINSEVTPEHMQDVLADQRAFIQKLVEKQASMQAQLVAMVSSRPPANVSPIASLAPAASPKPFKMRGPESFCAGADDRDRFVTHIKRLFTSHPQQFPSSALDRATPRIERNTQLASVDPRRKISTRACG
jgi:hypothetical protein